MADAVERLLDDTRIRAARMPTLAMVIDSESEIVAGATGG